MYQPAIRPLSLMSTALLSVARSAKVRVIEKHFRKATAILERGSSVLARGGDGLPTAMPAIIDGRERVAAAGQPLPEAVPA